MSKAKQRGYPIVTIGDLERKNSGRYFFTPETRGFFGSRVHAPVIQHRFFVTSEKVRFGATKRAATIRMIIDDGNVETVGEFLQHASPAAARKALGEALAAGVEVRHDPYDDVSDHDNPRLSNFRAYVGELPIGSRTSLWKAQRLAAQAKRPAYTG